MIGILLFLAAILLIVLFHEMGHLFVGRWVGIHCDKISIGFGPKLWGRFDSKGTEWVISPLPFGGYVRPRLEGTSIRQRIAMIAAGPFVSIFPPLFIMEAYVALKGKQSIISRIISSWDKIAEAGNLGLNGHVEGFNIMANFSIPDFTSWLILLAVLSVMIGILNLIPLMPFDGGRLFLAAFEAILGKDSKGYIIFEKVFSFIGVMFYLFLFIYPFYLDYVYLTK